jgi:GDPmannose 4,6-dehydratase
MASRVALITGIAGQDGGYLAEFLAAKGYDVHGLTHRAARDGGARLAAIAEAARARGTALTLHRGDLADAEGLTRLIGALGPDEIYNLAAQSEVPASFERPDETAGINALGALRLLGAIHRLGLADRSRFYQASTSELFGDVAGETQSETTPFQPANPYAVAKLYAHWITVTYRASFGLHASNGILFNHESPYRGDAFVSRKIARAVAAISLGLQPSVRLGNLDVERDWGHARDYVEGMWLMLQQARAGDYVLATGETHTVRDFVERAFACVDRRLEWRGRGADERGVDAATGAVLVEIDPALIRRTEIFRRRGDAAKARETLGWRPRTSFDELVREMVGADVVALKGGRGKAG